MPKRLQTSRSVYPSASNTSRSRPNCSGGPMRNGSETQPASAVGIGAAVTQGERSQRFRDRLHAREADRVPVLERLHGDHAAIEDPIDGARAQDRLGAWLRGHLTVGAHEMERQARNVEPRAERPTLRHERLAV